MKIIKNIVEEVSNIPMTVVVTTNILSRGRLLSRAATSEALR